MGAEPAQPAPAAATAEQIQDLIDVSPQTAAVAARSLISTSLVCLRFTN